MFDEYLNKQNWTLRIISSVIAGLCVISAAILIMEGHPFLALFEACIALALCALISTIINNNKTFIKKWESINDIEQEVFFKIDGPDELKNNVGNLDFKFRKDKDSE